MAPITRTEHPHIVVVHGAGGDEAIVKGTRLSVALLAGLLNRGESPDGILSLYPSLSPGALYDALSYYFDHKAEIDRQIQAGTPEEVLGELRSDPEMVEVGPGTFRRRKPFGSGG